MLNWLLDLFGYGPKGASRRRKDREFFDLGIDDWLKRRVAAREAGVESGPIYLPEGIRYVGLCRYDNTAKPDGHKPAANDNKNPSNNFVAPNAARIDATH